MSSEKLFIQYNIFMYSSWTDMVQNSKPWMLDLCLVGFCLTMMYEINGSRTRRDNKSRNRTLDSKEAKKSDVKED